MGQEVKVQRTLCMRRRMRERKWIRRREAQVELREVRRAELRKRMGKGKAEHEGTGKKDLKVEMKMKYGQTWRRKA